MRERESGDVGALRHGRSSFCFLCLASLLFPTSLGAGLGSLLHAIISFLFRKTQPKSHHDGGTDDQSHSEDKEYSRMCMLGEPFKVFQQSLIPMHIVLS